MGNSLDKEAILSGQTEKQYDEVINICKKIFEKKTRDYGTSWRILRLPSLTDQIFIKASRIRSIQEKGYQKIPDSIKEEFIGLINYAIVSLIQLKLNEADHDISLDVSAKAIEHYEEEVDLIKKLLFAKNHDYGEAWRNMRISSMTDLILMKLYRIKQIEDNQGQTLISEGVDAGYQDIVNYSIFCLIKIIEDEIYI